MRDRHCSECHTRIDSERTRIAELEAALVRLITATDRVPASESAGGIDLFAARLHASDILNDDDD